MTTRYYLIYLVCFLCFSLLPSTIFAVAPVANDDTTATQEDIALVIEVVANDSDLEDGTLDPCNVSITTPPANGTTSIGFAPACNLTYTPDPDFNGTDTFEYEVCDTNAECATAIVTVNVTSVNDFIILPYNPINEVDSTFEGNILNYINNVDGGPLIVTTTPVMGPSNGTVLINSDGTFTYTPNPGYTGLDSFSYEVCDTSIPPFCDIGVVSITNKAAGCFTIVCPLYPTNPTQPILNTTFGGYSVRLTSPNPTYGVLEFVANIAANLNDDGVNTAPQDLFKYTYTNYPNICNFEQECILYEVCDSTGFCMPYVITTILGRYIDHKGRSVPRELVCPSISRYYLSGNANTPQVATIEMGINSLIYEPEGSNFNAGSVAQGGNGTAVINSDGTVSYTPNPGFIGDDVVIISTPQGDFTILVFVTAAIPTLSQWGLIILCILLLGLALQAIPSKKVAFATMNASVEVPFSRGLFCKVFLGAFLFLLAIILLIWGQLSGLDVLGSLVCSGMLGYIYVKESKTVC